MKKNLKIGDKLLCKKTIYYRQEKDIDLIENEFYTIAEINSYAIKNILWFSIKHTTTSYLYYVWDYFYTPQEERKLKLKQLNKC